MTLVLAQVLLLSQLCQGQLSLDLDSRNSSGATPVLNWIDGPAKASLGGVADINVSKGYRFLEAKDARALLEQMKNPIPRNLEGVLSTESGSWMIVFNFVKTGFFNVKDGISDQINAAEVLKSIQSQVERQNASRWRDNLRPIGSTTWKIKPTYDPAQHTLEWAIQAGSGSGGVINHTVSLLGRNGVLNAIAVYPANLAATPLKELMSSVSFKAGQRYADYQGGDPVATVSLASLITDDKTADSQVAGNGLALNAGGDSQNLEGTASSTESHSVWRSASLWVSLSIIGIGALLLLKMMITRRPSKPKAYSASAMHGNGSLASAGYKPKLALNGNGNGILAGHHNGHHGQKRRKVFNYDKFYADMVLSVSSPGLMESSAQKEFSPFAPSHLTELLSQGGAQHHNQTASANSDLIAMQKHLIEEQKRLIQEQARLIQEKAKVIEEKNELIERQIDLFGSKTF